jgi:hypothetical protein
MDGFESFGEGGKAAEDPATSSLDFEPVEGVVEEVGFEGVFGVRFELLGVDSTIRWTIYGKYIAIWVAPTPPPYCMSCG